MPVYKTVWGCFNSFKNYKPIFSLQPFCQIKLNEAFNNFSVVHCTHLTGMWHGANGVEVLLIKNTGILTWSPWNAATQHLGGFASQFFPLTTIVFQCQIWRSLWHHGTCYTRFWSSCAVGLCATPPQWEQGGGMAAIWPCSTTPLPSRREPGERKAAFTHSVCVSWVDQMREGAVHHKDSLWTSVVCLTGARKAYS